MAAMNTRASKASNASDTATLGGAVGVDVRQASSNEKRARRRRWRDHAGLFGKRTYTNITCTGCNARYYCGCINRRVRNASASYVSPPPYLNWANMAVPMGRHRATFPRCRRSQDSPTSAKSSLGALTTPVMFLLSTTSTSRDKAATQPRSGWWWKNMKKLCHAHVPAGRSGDGIGERAPTAEDNS